MAPPLVAKQYALRKKSALHWRMKWKDKYKVIYVHFNEWDPSLQSWKKIHVLYGNVSQSSPSFCRCVSILCSKHARKRQNLKCFFCLCCPPADVNVQSQLRTPNEPDSVICYAFSYASEHSFIHFAKNRGIHVPTEKAVSKVFMFYSEEPEFPTSMLFGLCLGLAFWSGREHFIGVRQSGTLLAVQGTKSLHQGV